MASSYSLKNEELPLAMTIFIACPGACERFHGVREAVEGPLRNPPVPGTLGVERNPLCQAEILFTDSLVSSLHSADLLLQDHPMADQGPSWGCTLLLSALSS